MADDGRGLDPATTPKGHGLTNIRDRLDAPEGALEVLSVPDHGTSVSGSVPVVVSTVEATR